MRPHKRYTGGWVERGVMVKRKVWGTVRVIEWEGGLVLRKRSIPFSETPRTAHALPHPILGLRPRPRHSRQA